MVDHLLEIKDLRIAAHIHPPGEPSREIVIVDGISLTLEKGKVLGLIGESGAGKSTIGLASMAYGRGGCEIVGGRYAKQVNQQILRWLVIVFGILLSIIYFVRTFS